MRAPSSPAVREARRTVYYRLRFVSSVADWSESHRARRSIGILPMFYKHNDEHVAAEEFDGEFVLINFARGTYFSLRLSAVDVWRQFRNGASPALWRAASASASASPAMTRPRSWSGASRC